jgi:hypothetical protein
MGEYNDISSLYQFIFLKIDDCVNFSYLGCIVELFLTIYAIPHHLKPFHIHTSSGVDEGLKVFILLDACVGITWAISLCSKIECLRLAKSNLKLIVLKGAFAPKISFWK